MPEGMSVTEFSSMRGSSEVSNDDCAFPSLQANESIEQLMHLCQTDREEVRDAAKQTLLLLGNHSLTLLQGEPRSDGYWEGFLTDGEFLTSAFQTSGPPKSKTFVDKHINRNYIDISSEQKNKN